MMKRMNGNLIKKIIYVLFAFVTITITELKPTTWMEVDSYVLPMISIQYRGSIVCTQADIEQAKIDFPTLYAGVNTFDDLRSAKLNIIDENHWYTFYFPIYAVICMPTKILLQFLNLDQSKCFSITAGLLLILTVFLYLKEEKKVGKPYSRYLICLFIIASPIWVNIQYIGIEPVAYSFIFIALLFWRKQHYRAAALVVSVVCMANPAIMGLGIAIFIDYFLSLFDGEKNILGVFKRNISRIIKMCICYVPSLIPFATNFYFFHKFYTAIATAGVEDTVFDRAMAYMFDWNLGIASFAPVLIFVFWISVAWSIKNKNRHLLLQAMGYISMLAFCSTMILINAGMNNCARYQMWMYPVVAITVYDFLNSLSAKREGVRYGIALGSLVITCLFMLYDWTYSYIDMSPISKKILDYCPNAYISFCNSTFNSRVNHIDGGYNPQEYAIYSDSNTGEIRKIQYRNTDENKKNLLAVIRNCDTSSNDLTWIKNELKETDGKIHYISIGRNKKTQFQKVLGFDFVSAFSNLLGREEKIELNSDIAVELEKKDSEAVDMLWSWICQSKYASLSDKDYISFLYEAILGRSESEDENAEWTTQLEKGISRKDVLSSFLSSEEFRVRNGYY